MEPGLPNYRYLNLLALQYVEQRHLGFGTSLNDRSPQQAEIVNSFIVGVKPEIEKMSKHLVRYGEYIPKTFKLDIPLVLRVGSDVREHLIWNDLSQAGLLKILEKFHTYVPSKGPALTFGILHAYHAMEAEAYAAYPKGLARSKQRTGNSKVRLDDLNQTEGGTEGGTEEGEITKRSDYIYGGMHRMDPGDVVDVSSRHHPLRDAWERALDSLPGNQKYCMEARLGVDMEPATNSEIAGALGVTPSTVKQHVFRATKDLKKSLDPYRQDLGELLDRGLMY